MDTATAALRNEHKALNKGLSFTESVAAQIRRGEVVRPAVLGQATECFRIFLDDCLLAKEEDFLFSMLERKGMSRQSGPIGLMLMQHETGRKLVKEMGKAAAEHYAGDGGAGNRWAFAALDFVDLMRDHVKEEEAVLFMMVDSFLQSGEQAELAARFEKLEVAKSASGRHKKIHALPEELPQEDVRRQLAG